MPVVALAAEYLHSLLEKSVDMEWSIGRLQEVTSPRGISACLVVGGQE